MSEFTEFIPTPIADHKQLFELLQFWNEEICIKKTEEIFYIHSVILGTEGTDEGKNLVWFKSSKTPPVPPAELVEFPITLSKKECRDAIAKLEAEKRLQMRSFAVVRFGTNDDRWVALLDEIQTPPPATPATPAAPAPPTPTTPAPTQVKLEKVFSKVFNRGKPDLKFIQELVAWAKTADDSIFINKPTPERDVYASVAAELGPFGDLLHRKACMLEVMRVLAGFESSWDWNEGLDKSKAERLKGSAAATEAGAWQVSADSRNFGDDLKKLVVAKIGKDIHEDKVPVEFQAKMKSDHPFAMEYIARLLRLTIRHNGPVKRSEIDEWLSRGAVEEFKRLLA